MKEAFELIRKRLEPEADFFGGEPMGSLQKAYYCKGVEKAMEIVSEVEAEYGKDINVRSNGWIPCSERLPENDDDVLVYYQYKIMQGVNVVGWKETLGVGYYYNPSNDWIFYGGFGLDRHAIAWMSLPEPYKKGE